MLLFTHVNSLIFRAESIGNIYRIYRSHLEAAGGQVDQGQEEVHHVDGRVVQNTRYTYMHQVYFCKTNSIGIFIITIDFSMHYALFNMLLTYFILHVKINK
jgi:hypothetical protein